MRVLLIEDDPSLAELVAANLRDLPATVAVFENGWQGLDAASREKFDLAVLDWMLPGLNGLEICRKIRASGQRFPILMLTARADEADKIAGLETGADDYLTKPFSVGELMARVRALLRRTGLEAKISEKNLTRLVRGPLEMDFEKHEVRRSGQLVELTLKEFELLHFFMQNPGRACSRAELLDLVWGEQFEGLEHTVNSHINRLRAKIEENPAEPRFILTAWGVGYKFFS